MIDDKKVLMAGILMFISGILHVIGSILSIGLITLVVTFLIFSGFFLLLGLRIIKIIRYDLLDRTKRIIIFCTTISFLNFITILTHGLTATPGDRIYLYVFVIIFIIIDLINFPIFFIRKIELDQMDFNDKLSYFTIVIIKGLGLGLLFNVLAWIGVISDLNLYMIMYILVFGTLNMIYGELLYAKKEEKKIQNRAIIILVLGLIFETTLIFFFPNAKSLVDIILLGIIIPIRIYYIKKKF